MITWPLLQNEIRANSVNNTFGNVRKKKDGSPKSHQGWDFKAYIGTPIYAVGSGKVIFKRNQGDYGLQLCHSFEHNGHIYYAFYAHLSEILLTGNEVIIDDLVAKSGESGNAKGMSKEQQHLHFEIRTQRHCGKGLIGRISPIALFGICPLNDSVNGNSKI
jgi:murein DD-endopeptidase MepM/ murein hydrolase activator NlpD